MQIIRLITFTKTLVNHNPDLQLKYGISPSITLAIYMTPVKTVKNYVDIGKGPRRINSKIKKPNI